MARFVVYTLLIPFIVVLIWFFFYHQIGVIERGSCFEHNCVANTCYGAGCPAGECEGNRCRAGDCHGEKCQAGDCHGFGCQAGNCYGYGCKPGRCKEPDIAQCQHGKAFLLTKHPIQKYFKNGTVFNRKLCFNRLLENDLHERINNFRLNKVFYNDKGDIVGTDPVTFKDDNCNICTNDKCSKYVPKYNGYVDEWQWIIAD